MGIEMIDESYDQPFKTGPLIDQQGNYALFDILMNKEMFDYIKQHKLYSKTEQQSEANSRLKVDFPAGVNFPKDGRGGHPGGIIIKVSWKILDSGGGETQIPHRRCSHIHAPSWPEQKPPCCAQDARAGGLPCDAQDRDALAVDLDVVRARRQCAEQQEIKIRKLKRRTVFTIPAMHDMSR